MTGNLVSYTSTFSQISIIILTGNPHGGKHFGELCIGGRIILKQSLRRQDVD
jgi:hypothetical protein